MAAKTSSRKLLVWALAGLAVLAVVVVVAVAALSGRGGNPRAIGLRNVPVPAGARVVTRARSCDRGVNRYCALQVVVEGEEPGQTYERPRREEPLAVVNEE